MNSIQFNPTNGIMIQLNLIQIQLKKKEMQIGGESIENQLMSMKLKKKNFRKTQIWKDTFPFFFRMG